MVGCRNLPVISLKSTACLNLKTGALQRLDFSDCDDQNNKSLSVISHNLFPCKFKIQTL